jgi:hypothetical protein
VEYPRQSIDRQAVPGPVPDLLGNAQETAVKLLDSGAMRLESRVGRGAVFATIRGFVELGVAAEVLR